MGPVGTAPSGANRLFNRLWQTDPRLTGFAVLMVVLMLPTAMGIAIDDRVLRDANVWIKPLKFQLSLAVLALTLVALATALPMAVRAGRSWRALTWTVLITGGFEIAYIALQAGLGQASHYNIGTPLHGMLYTTMGVAALALTATQPWLAVLLWRHAPRTEPLVWRHAVALGLWLSFILGAGVGMLLGGLQPAGGVAVPVLGWSLEGADLRPAHFVGLHAAQALPLLALALMRSRVAGAAGVAIVWAAAAAGSLLCAGLVVRALAGQPFWPL
jgi:hypothetical protein